MCVSDPRAKLLDGNLRIFTRSGERMVRVPEEANVIGTGGVQNILQCCGRSEMVVGFDDHSNVFRASIRAEFAQTGRDSSLGRIVRRGSLVRISFAAKHPHVWRIKS